MKAALVTGPNALAVREVHPPEPGEYDAVCRIVCGATCTGTDTHLIQGRWPWPLKYPFILGHESIGRVVAVGPRVRNYRVGELITRVGAPPSPRGEYFCNWGGFAEVGIARDHVAMREDGLPREQWWANRVNCVLPSGSDPAAATMFITWRETLSYLTRMGVGAGSRVLVLGSGGNGLSFARHAHNLGATLVAMVGSAAREPLARSLGVSACFDYADAEWPRKAAAACPDGFDFIIDAVGRQGALTMALPTLKPGGTTGIYGMDDYNTTAINPRKARGTFSYYNGGYNEAETHDRVVEFVRTGALDARAWLDSGRRFSLAKIQDAFDAVARRECVKAVVQIEDGDSE